jgi:hypothetical protein
MSNILEKEKIILKTWKGNQYGTILLALPHEITKKYDLEKPTHVILEKQSNGFFIKKLEVQR